MSKFSSLIGRCAVLPCSRLLALFHLGYYCWSAIQALAWLSRPTSEVMIIKALSQTSTSTSTVRRALSHRSFIHTKIVLDWIQEHGLESSSAIACLATPYTPSTMAATHPFFHVEAHVCARHHVRATLQISDDHSPQPQAHFETVYMFKEAAMHAASAAWRRLTLFQRLDLQPDVVIANTAVRRERRSKWRRWVATSYSARTAVVDARSRGQRAGPTPTETKRAELGRTVGVGGLETSTSVAVFVESSPWPNRAVLVPSSASSARRAQACRVG
ncbi:hypothetical protein BJ912DRAFT_1043308 [Pholiota molesta]|nr:hypothetical protein BJ912DRAFT_1043308 [Pholiota molesta]